jgi:hypothetical protein
MGLGTAVTVRRPCLSGTAWLRPGHEDTGGLAPVNAQAGARQRGEESLVLGERAAFAGAILVVRRPLNELLGFLVAPAARRNRRGAEVPGLPFVQAREADLGRRANEHRQIEVRRDRLAPAHERAA